MTKYKLKHCPFCGGAAGFEPVERLGYTAWTVGCRATDMDCIGTQMIASYGRQQEAADAWNKRYNEPSHSSDESSENARKKRPSRARVGSIESMERFVAHVQAHKQHNGD